MEKKRNGALCFWAFIFCMVIVLHYSYFFNPKKAASSVFPFYRGELAFDFFFITAGAALAKWVGAASDAHAPLWRDCGDYLKNQLRLFLPAFALCWAVSFVVLSSVLWVDLRSAINHFFTSLLELLPIRSAGFNPPPPDSLSLAGYRVMDQVWALSAVILASALFYPLYRQNRKRFEYYIAPVGAALLLCFLFFKLQVLTGDDLLILDAKNKTLYYFSVGMCKAMGEVLAGVSAYVIARHFRDKEITKAKSHLLSVIELGAYLSAIAYMQFMLRFDLPLRFDFLCAGAILVGITISLTGKSSVSKLFDNRFFRFLGRFSLYPFLTFMIFAKTLPFFLPDMGTKKLMLVYLALTLVSAVILMALEKPFIKLLKAIKNLLVKPAPTEKETA